MHGLFLDIEFDGILELFGGLVKISGISYFMFIVAILMFLDHRIVYPIVHIFQRLNYRTQPLTVTFLHLFPQNIHSI